MKDGPAWDDGLLLSKAMNDQIHFDLTGFRVGNLNEIADKPWTWLVEGPTDALFVPSVEIPVGFQKGNIKKSFPITYADAAWKPEPPGPIETHEDRKTTSKVPNISEVLNSMGKPISRGRWTRYASYSVVAMLRGRTISYRAAFLFSHNETGEEVLALDYATAMGISHFVHTPMYPSALVDTVFRELPFIQAWIVSNEITGCKKFTVPEVCCDARMGRCGLASEDLQRSLSTPVDPDMRSILVTRQPTPIKKGEKK